LTVGLTLLVEGVTCIGRFGLGVRGMRSTRWLAPFTFRLRVHHAYTGALVAAVAAVGLSSASPWRLILVCTGLALSLSDLVHHFIVLPLFTGATDFDVLYPETS
jgi:hypothetical protein